MSTETLPLKEPPPRCRRWIPLSLRLCVMIVGVMALWTGVRAYDQNRAIRTIVKAGGSVQSRPAGLAQLFPQSIQSRLSIFDEVWIVELPLTARTDEILKEVADLPDVAILHLEGGAITDTGLVLLKGMRRLKLLILNSTQVTDAGLAQLRWLTELEQLELLETHVTDRGVAELERQLPGLQVYR